MAKILNLDQLETKNKPRELVIDGVTHTIADMSVENFITTTRAAERLEGASISDQIEATVELIVRLVPTLKPEQLNKRPLETLATISAFVQGHNVEEAEEAVEGTEAGK